MWRAHPAATFDTGGNEAMEDVITALGDAERKLIGVVLSELQPTTVNRQRDQQYA